MHRTPPSRADRDMIADLQENGLTVTPYQLEHWRQHGLLPRPTVRRHRRSGSSVEPHSLTTLRAAYLLGQHSVRGAPWQDLTWHLVFEHLPVTLTALRASTERAVLRPHAAVIRLWTDAVSGLPPSFVLNREQLLQIADLVVDLAGKHRAFRRSLGWVSKEIRRANYISDPVEVERAARVALGLRLALLAGTRLRGELVQLARYGLEHPPAHRPVFFALPFDKLATARSLTHAEADVSIEWILALDELDVITDEDRGRDPLEMVATEVALRRLNSPPWFSAANALDPSALQTWDDDNREWLEDYAAPEQEPLPFDNEEEALS